MITNKIIEELYPTLDSLWEVAPNNRNRWGSRDIWQIPNRSSFRELVHIINSLESVSDMTLLEFGCAEGLHSIVASQKFKKVVAIDNDIVSCRRAKVTKEIFEKKGYNLSNLEIKNISFYDYDFSDINAFLKCAVGGSVTKEKYEPILNHVNLVIWKTKSGDDPVAVYYRKELRDILKNKYHFNLGQFKVGIVVGKKNE